VGSGMSKTLVWEMGTPARAILAAAAPAIAKVKNN